MTAWRESIVMEGMAQAFAGQKHLILTICFRAGISLSACVLQEVCAAEAEVKITLNETADGYRGIWYMNQPSGDEYVYKYSGGMGTYCAKHNPFAVYSRETERTYFCYGGAPEDDSRKLLHMVSYFDHKTGTVPRPTLLLDKRTDDAHDNPVISLDGSGHLWIFSTSHGTSRPSWIHRSVRPHDISAFELVKATYAAADGETREPLTNFSYMQAWWRAPGGFACFFTRYNQPATRTICFMTSGDGVSWSRIQTLAAMGEGHYQISATAAGRMGSAFNFHPKGKGLNWRTNLYYIESTDGGSTFHSADGTPLALPLKDPATPAMVHDYQAEGRNVYLKDIAYDAGGRPVILYLTSGGYESGPANAPRTWHTARWTGSAWDIRPVTESDNNYDMGSLWLEEGKWRIIAPTAPGPQLWNPGGEVALWESTDAGGSWREARRMTHGSGMNHNYIRRPVEAQDGFTAFWADGHGRQPSESRLYFSNAAGDVFRLPRKMQGESAVPERVP